MDESDEDIDPVDGPIAELMAEHNLSSTKIQSPSNEKKLVESIETLDQKIKIRDYLSVFNIRSLCRDVFNYILDIQWYRSINSILPKNEQEVFLTQEKMSSSLKKLCFFLIVSISLYQFSVSSKSFSFLDLCNINLLISIYFSCLSIDLYFLYFHR
jgi:hypothetical protein